jgi:hypothetical protein
MTGSDALIACYVYIEGDGKLINSLQLDPLPPPSIAFNKNFTLQRIKFPYSLLIFRNGISINRSTHLNKREYIRTYIRYMLNNV